MGQRGSLFEHVFHPHVPKDVNQLHDDQLTFGEKLADQVASSIGSWNFIVIQAGIMVLWVLFNVLTLFQVFHFDSYPFVFLNLAMSAEAAFSGPVIMMSQNRQAAKDRLTAENDYKTDMANADYIKQMIMHLNQQDEELVKQTSELFKQTDMILDIIRKLEPPKK